ncbi:hypothetical protein SDC9_108278 [bioreactor metagenome]|uniref:Uncharacterized protein n=1 Tax=bioreactor metagenome TaxID=1076179 RepID=A0A645B7I6_9ZZZZ
MLKDAISAITPQSGKKNSTDTITHEGIAVAPKYTALLAMLVKPNVGTNISITNAHNLIFLFSPIMSLLYDEYILNKKKP